MSSTPHFSSATRSIPRPKAKPGVALGVVADGLEHRRVHHAAAEDLEPAGPLAHATVQPRPAARSAADVHLGAGLGVREEARTEPQLALGAEQLAQNGEQRALQIGERDVLADDQPFDLGEHRRVREVEVVAPVDAAGRDQPHRRLVRLHVADLHARRVRAQQRGGRCRRATCSGRREIQRVLHVARGMLGRHVERFEVVVVVLELGPLEDEEAHAAEDRFDALAQQRQRMAVAERRGPARQRDVDRVRRRARRLGRREPRVEARFDVLLELVRQLAEERTRRRRAPTRAP